MHSWCGWLISPVSQVVWAYKWDPVFNVVRAQPDKSFDKTFNWKPPLLSIRRAPRVPERTRGRAYNRLKLFYLEDSGAPGLTYWSSTHTQSMVTSFSRHAALRACAVRPLSVCHTLSVLSIFPSFILIVCAVSLCWSVVHMSHLCFSSWGFLLTRGKHEMCDICLKFDLTFLLRFSCTKCPLHLKDSPEQFTKRAYQCKKICCFHWLTLNVSNTSDADKNTIAHSGIKCQYFLPRLSHPPFPPSLSFHPLTCSLYSKLLLCSLLQCDVWVLTLKNGFSKIKSLHMRWRHLSCLAAFTPICRMPRRTTQNYNHHAKQTTCFEDQIAIWAKIRLRRLHLWLNSCWYNGMINVTTIKRQIEPQPFFLYVTMCVRRFYALCIYFCARVCGCEHELAWSVAFRCLPVLGKYQCEGVYNQGME